MYTGSYSIHVDLNLNNNLNNFFVLHDMQMGLESLESTLKSASSDTKINLIACWEHAKPENTIHCNGIF